LETEIKTQAASIKDLYEDCEKCRIKKLVDGLVKIVITAVVVALLALVIGHERASKVYTPPPYSTPQSP
jgi:hypothetical protein